MNTRKVLGLVAVACAVVTLSQRAFAQQTAYTWDVLGGGSQNWQNAANWSPNTAFPNLATDDADFDVALTSNLTVDVGATDVTVGNITLGGTAGAVTTAITSSGGGLIISDSSGNGSLISQGVAGSVNQIGGTLVLADGTTEYDIGSTQALAITGNIGQLNAAQTLKNSVTGLTLTIGSGPSSTIALYDYTAGTGTARNFALTNNSSTATGGIAQATTVNAVWDNGGGTGTISFGADSNSRNAGMVYTMQQPQTSTATVNIGRQKYVLEADNPFGIGTLVANNSNQTNWGGLLQSNSDSRSVGNSQIQVGNNFAVAGSNSLTFTGTFGLTNNRNIGNNLDAGKTWTLSGPVYPNVKAADANPRTITLDGTGTTVISGTLNNNIDFNSTIVGNVTTRGTGRLELTNAANTISGVLTSNGGLIVFGTQGSYGATTGGAAGTGSSIVTSYYGGVSYTPGTADAGFATFASKLNGGTGYLALPAGDAAANLDFSGSGALATAPGLSVTADGALTYTGTVTPGAQGYRWGGPQGRLTLGSNAGTGANAVTYTNGGDVLVAGSPDYTGVTTISGGTYTSAKVYITNGQNTNSTQTFNAPTTLEVTSLGNAGSASSLGASSGDAANLVLNMGTLKVNASTATSTDRLFTIGTSGATLESAGAGLVTIGSGGGANVGPSSAATLTLTGTGNGTLGSVLANGVGALSLAKTGTGTWSLDATNTYTGTTTVSAGTLIVNGALGSGAVTVASGAELSMGAGSTLLFSTAGPTATSNGTMTFASGFGVANLVGLDVTVPAGTYTLVTGTVDTSNLSNVGSANAYTYAPDHTAYFLPGSLNLVVVPEPTGLAALAAGTALLGWRLRRRTTV